MGIALRANCQNENVRKRKNRMNREKLAQLIYWMRSFTEDDLSKACGPPRSSQSPATVPSVRDYLDNLKQAGVLAFEGGRYLLLNPAKRHRTA